MKSPYIRAVTLLILAGTICALVLGFREYFVLLKPAGLIARSELSLMLDISSLMLITAVAVFGLAFFFATWYREGARNAIYLPNWEHGTLSELVWWAIPFEIVLILGALTWSSTHELDPPRALAPPEETLTIEVVALPWKWLFIYPEQGIASVGEVHLPVGTPVEFKITADAPMNSFWIPALGGQMYAMTGMITELNLVADEEGTYQGRSANYSGEGFAHMTFTTYARGKEEFDTWVTEAKGATTNLSLEAYHSLRAPSIAEPPRVFGGVADNLFETVIMKYMGTHIHVP